MYVVFRIFTAFMVLEADHGRYSGTNPFSFMMKDEGFVPHRAKNVQYETQNDIQLCMSHTLDTLGIFLFSKRHLFLPPCRRTAAYMKSFVSTNLRKMFVIIKCG